MSKSSYLGANVATNNSFGGWIDKTNQVRHDMGTVVVTVGDVVQPNTTNGAETSGNAHVEGIFSATTLSAVDALTGGTVSVPAILSITSNAEFTSTNGTIDVTSSINLFTVDANNVVVSSNVVFDGGATKIFKIDAANTTINTGSFYAKSNTYISGPNTYITSIELKSISNTIITGARVDLDGTTFDVTSNTVITSASFTANSDAIILGNVGTDTLVVNSISDFNANVNIDGVLTTIRSTNTMIGDAGTDVLNVNAVSDFNANVNIDGIFTQTANATFSGALVNITSANTTVGDAGTDKLNVNSTSDFNANVNIDGIFTQTANAVFSGALVNVTSANTTIGDAGTDKLNVNATSSFSANSSFSGALVTITGANTTIGDAGTDKLNVNATSDFNANVNIDGILTQTANAVFSGALVNVTSANTTIGDAGTDVLNVNATSSFSANSSFSGALVTITGANTTVGDAGTDKLNVNATSDFNANVSITSTSTSFTVAANTTLSGALVNVTSANTTIGDAGTDKLNVNATSDFNANVNIDGILTQTGNATFSGANVYITSANTTVGDAGTDKLNVNATSDFNANVNIDGVLTTIRSTNTMIGEAGTDKLNVNAVSDFNANVSITSTSTAFTVAANTTLSGANVYITSANTTIGDAGTDILNVNATSDFNANVNIDGILTQTANATFSGALVNITSANTTVGDAGTDKLNVNATSDFNANVNIDGLLTQTANATFTGALVNITGANTTIGDAGTDVLNVNATADFNAGVNIDGLLTQTANATFSGAETYFNNNVTLGATTADTVSILGYVDANVLPSAITVDLGSDAKPFGNVHTTYVWSDNNIDTQGDFIVRGSTTRTLKALSTNTGYQTFNLVLETSTSNQKLPLVANSTGIHGGANTTYDLGSTAINWNKLYVKDAAVANSAVVSSVLTVNSQANTASLMVRDLTVNRVPFVSTGGEIVDSANLTFTSSTLAVTGNTTISANLSVTNVISAANVVSSTHVSANTLGTSGLATLNSMNVVNTATFNANVDLQDSDYLLIGTSDDLQLFHDGLHSYIKDTGTGDLIVDASIFRVMNAANTENMIVATEDAGVILYANNIARIETTLVGANVTGTFGTSGLSTLESANVTNSFQVNGLSSLVGNTAFANNVTITGDLTVSGTTNLATNTNFTVNNAIATTSTVNGLFTNNGNTVLGDTNADIVTINAKIASSIIPNANNTYDLGATGTGLYKTIYANNFVGATAWASVTDKPDPVITVTLSGDVVGTGNTTLTDLASGTISFATTIQANSVALGDDTTGNYMKQISANTQPVSGVAGTATYGSGITVSHTASEGSTAYIGHADTSSATSLAVSQAGGNVLQSLSTTIDTFGHVTAISSASTNLDNRYPQVTFKTITVDDTDTEYTWAATGSAVADGLTDTLTFVSGTDINIDVDATSDAIRVTNTSTLQTVTDRGATTNNAISITNTTDASSTSTGALKVSGGVGIAKKLYVGTTMNVTGAATFANTASFANNVTISGDLTVNGTTTTINSTTVTYDDKNIELGSVVSPSDAGANGGGITLKGTTDKTFNWVDATDAWSSSEHINLLSSKEYYINGNSVLNSTTLGSGVTASSLTSVGTLSTGTWSASTIAVNKGGTGQTTYTNGQLLIGNTTGNTLSKATLTAGSNVTITNGPGSITIAAGATNLAYVANTLFGTVTSSTGSSATIPAANSTVAGLVTTGTQTFAGAKTFSSDMTITKLIDSTNSAYYLDPAAGITGTTAGSRLNNLRVESLWQGVPASDGPILTYTLTSGGSGYTNGTYLNQVLSGGSGVYATFDFTVSGGVVTVATLTERGSGFSVGDTIAIPALGGSGSGGLITVNSVTDVDISLYGTARGSRIRLASADPTLDAGQEIGSLLFNTRDNSSGGGGDKVQIIAKAESTSGGGKLEVWTSANGQSPTLCAAFGGSNDFQLYNAAGNFYSTFLNTSITANRTVNLPDATVTLVSGTMVPTTGTGATGSWGISITGNANTATTASVATTIALVATNTTAATHYPVFVDTATGNENPRTDTGFTYNPSTGVLTSTSFAGALSGNATSANTATTATTIALVATNTANTTHYPVFVDTATGNENPRTDTGFTYNPSTGVLTSTSFAGDLSGNATSANTATTATTASVATTIALVATDTANTTHYPVFVDTATGNENPRTDTGFTYNPSTGVLTSTSFAGDLSGNATSATSATTASVATTIALVATNTTAATHYPVFADAATGNENPRTDIDFTYNPSTGVLTSTTFSGALSGNATTATTATTATAATVTTSATASDFVIPFVNSTAATTGNYGLLQDSVASFTYNPSTNVVTAGTFSGALSGNATTSSSTTGNAATATKLATAKAIALTGAVTGTVNFDGSANVSITTTATSDPTLTLTGDASGSATFTNLGDATLTVVVADDSHSHAFNNLSAKTGGTGNYTTTGTFTAATFNATSTTDGGFQGIDADTIALPSFTWTSDLDTGMWHAAADQIGFTTAGVNRMTISSTGISVVGAIEASGNIASTSDARLKENVVTIDSALNKVEQMRGVYFNKIDDETKTRNVGVIAQEMEEVLPEVVYTREDGMKSVAYANIVGVLIEAIKELKAEIDILKANK